MITKQIPTVLVLILVLFNTNANSATKWSASFKKDYMLACLDGYKNNIRQSIKSNLKYRASSKDLDVYEQASNSMAGPLCKCTMINISKKWSQNELLTNKEAVKSFVNELTQKGGRCAMKDKTFSKKVLNVIRKNLSSR